jgi:hypothetical protein
VGWESTHRGVARWESSVMAMHRGGNRRIAAPRAVRGFGALVGGLAGIASAVEVSAWQRGAILDSPYSHTSLGGHTMSHGVPWWPHDEPSRAVVATRSRTTRLADSSHPHLARIGVGAVQNRPQNHRVIRDIYGDAGQPAHQRHKTPRCARHHPRPLPTPLIPHPPPIRALTSRASCFPMTLYFCHEVQARSGCATWVS